MGLIASKSRGEEEYAGQKTVLSACRRSQDRPNGYIYGGKDIPKSKSEASTSIWLG